MVAVILDPDSHGRAVARALLAELGYSRVLEADSRERAQYYLEREGERTSLILSGWDVPEFRLGQWIATRRELALTPLLLLSNRSLSWVPRRSPRPHSRVDALLTKPFGSKALLNAIFLAHARRAESRTILAYVGTKDAPRLLLESTYSPATHLSGHAWAEVRSVREPHSVDDPGFGALVIDPAGDAAGTSLSLRRFRKTRLGCVTPVAALSKDPRVIHEFRTLVDLFFDRPESAQDWDRVLRVTAARLRSRCRSQWLHARCRQALDEGRARRAFRLAKDALEADPTRFESQALMGSALELCGNPERAGNFYRAALLTNPCNPAPYLRLLEIAPAEDRVAILEAARRYCPEHPQLKGWGSRA